MSNHWTVHGAALILVWVLVCLPNLGAAHLWDIDEGNNAECAREMFVTDNWIVPTFNFSLRTDKPALLYWLQMSAYAIFGVNEFSARLPCALAILGTVLIVYFLGRSLFGPESGLLAAVALAISPGAVGAGHFANPDALLLLCTTGALALFWVEMAHPGRGSLFGVGACCGLGILAKGPVGLILPAAVGAVFIAWSGRWRWLLTPRLGLLLLAVILVAGPWYGLVAAETKGAWVREFWNKHNAERALTVMEGHGGPFFYYLLVLVPGLLPWSIFLAPATWDAWTRRNEDTTGAGYQYLLSWAGVYVVFFSLAQTKLPNYVLPAYPPLALLLGHWGNRWITGAVTLPAWLERLGVLSLGVIGIAVTVGIVLLEGYRDIHGLTNWAWVGLFLTGGAIVSLVYLMRDNRLAASAALTLTGLVCIASVAGGMLPLLNDAKATPHLAAALPADHREREVILAASEYFQPSLVFYARRQVASLPGPAETARFLNQPLPVYVFLPEDRVEEVQQLTDRARVLTVRRDLYRGTRVAVITNQ